MERLFRKYSQYKILRIENDDDEGLQEKILERIKYRNQMIFLWVSYSNIQKIIDMFWIIHGQIADFYCQLDGNIIKDINEIHMFGKEINMLTNMQKLSLSLINMNQKIKEFACLFENITSVCKLEYLSLDLRGNQISEESYKEISVALQKLKKLRHLELLLSFTDTNNLRLIHLGDSLQQMGQLETIEIDLSRNSIDSKGLEKFLCSFGKSKFQDLQVLILQLDNNKLKDENGICNLSHMINNFKGISLIKLHLQECQIQDRELKQFVNLIENNINIKHFKLDLSFNNLSNQRYSYVSQLLEKMTGLQDLELDLGQRQNLVDKKEDLIKFCKKLTQINFMDVKTDLKYVQEFLYSKNGYMMRIKQEMMRIIIIDKLLKRIDKKVQLKLWFI